MLSLAPLTAACCIRVRSHATPCNGPSVTHSLTRSLIFFLPRVHCQAADGASSAEMGGGGPAVLAPSSSNDDPSQPESRVDGAQLPAKKQRLPSKVHAPQSRSPHTTALTHAHAHLAVSCHNYDRRPVTIFRSAHARKARTLRVALMVFSAADNVVWSEGTGSGHICAYTAINHTPSTFPCLVRLSTHQTRLEWVLFLIVCRRFC
jgi:hypothetical protein